MANVEEKFGLRPYRKLDGTPLAGAQNRYKIADNSGTAIFQGDLVRPLTNGTITRAAGNTSYAVVGVFNGCFYNDPTTQKPTYSNFYPGSINPTQGRARKYLKRSRHKVAQGAQGPGTDGQGPQRQGPDNAQGGRART